MSEGAIGFFLGVIVTVPGQDYKEIILQSDAPLT